MTASYNICFISNSPGELNYWVKPIAMALKKSSPTTGLYLFLVPCQFASGNEKEQASGWELFENVYAPSETLMVLMKPDFRFSGMVLFLGGDPLYGRLLSLRLGLPLAGYSEHTHNLGWRYLKTFNRFKDGDLMATGIVPKKRMEPYRVHRIGFLPGSRPNLVNEYWPILRETILIIQSSHPDIECIVNVSDTAPLPGQCHDSSLTIVNEESSDFFKSVDYLIAIPGSNNAEAMYYECPMSIIIPLNRPDLIPIGGLIGLIGTIPLLGYLLKKGMVYVLSKLDKTYSLPNKLLPTQVVPELIDKITPESFAQFIIEKIHDQHGIDQQLSAFKQFNDSRPKHIVEHIVHYCLAPIVK